MSEHSQGRAHAEANAPQARGQVEPKCHISDLTFHGLRHTLTSMLKSAGVSSAVAEEIVGHEGHGTLLPEL